MKEFNLSDKEYNSPDIDCYLSKDIKEFIKRVSRRTMTWIEEGHYDDWLAMLKQEAGDKLTSSEPQTNNHTQKNSSGACTSMANEDSVLKARSSENSQHPRIKPDRGEELKPCVAGDKLDNGSSADAKPLTEVKE